MNVRELIKELKKEPQDLRVGVAMHDNDNGVVAGWAFSVVTITEKVPIGLGKEHKPGDKCVVIQC
jgi:hypothetical protein